MLGPAPPSKFSLSGRDRRDRRIREGRKGGVGLPTEICTGHNFPQGRIPSFPGQTMAPPVLLCTFLQSAAKSPPFLYTVGRVRIIFIIPPGAFLVCLVCCSRFTPGRSYRPNCHAGGIGWMLDTSHEMEWRQISIGGLGCLKPSRRRRQKNLGSHLCTGWPRGLYGTRTSDSVLLPFLFAFPHCCCLRAKCHGEQVGAHYIRQNLSAEPPATVTGAISLYVTRVSAVIRR